MTTKTNNRAAMPEITKVIDLLRAANLNPGLKYASENGIELGRDAVGVGVVWSPQ